MISGGINAHLAELMLLPDVALRVGPRSILFLTLGLGAYDAPTSLRPGLYAGLSVPVKRLTAFIHYGLHFELGCYGLTVLQLDPRLDFSLTYAVSQAVSVGVGVASQSSGDANGTLEGRGTVSVGL